MTDADLTTLYRLDGVIATVDAAVGMATLDAQEEAIKQAAMADRILLTKTDLICAEDRAAIEARLHSLNPAAPVSRAVLWRKGEHSGFTQQVERILVDDDQDALILHVRLIGPGSCHVGYRSCFYRELVLPAPEDAPVGLRTIAPSMRKLSMPGSIIRRGSESDGRMARRPVQSR